MKSYEWLIAIRYLRGKHHNNRFASFVARLAIGGLILGIAALIIILSVMNGFQSEFKHKLLSGIAEAQVVDNQQSAFSPSSSILMTLHDTKEVLAFAPYLDGQGILRTGESTAGIFIRGVSAQQEPQVSAFAHRLIAGHWLQGKPWEVTVGSDLAQMLHLDIGDHFVIITANTSNPLTGWLPRMRNVYVTGIFELGLYEYDSSFVLMNLSDAQKLFSHPQSISGLRLKLRDKDQAPSIAQQLTTRLGKPYLVIDWTRSHQAFFKAVETEKTVMFVILTLIIMVAAFNIVSSLVMVVHEKKKDIAILKTLGMTPRSLLRIFFLQGLIIGIIGTSIGTAIGIFISLHLHAWSLALEHALHIQFLSKEVYMIHELPAQLRLGDLILTTVLSLLLCLLAAVYPAMVAARTHPAEALREHT